MKVTFKKLPAHLSTTRYGRFPSYDVLVDGRNIGTLQNQKSGSYNNWVITKMLGEKTDIPTWNRQSGVEALVAASGVEV